MLSHVADAAAKDSPTGSNLGGQSLLVDGFHAANTLKQEDPKAFEVLTRAKLPWHASGNEGITIAPDKLYPVLEVDERTGNMHRVRWNNDDRGVVPFTQAGGAEWYEAARKWHSILTRKDMEYWFQLKPGNLLSKSRGRPTGSGSTDMGTSFSFRQLEGSPRAGCVHRRSTHVWRLQ